MDPILIEHVVDFGFDLRGVENRSLWISRASQREPVFVNLNMRGGQDRLGTALRKADPYQERCITGTLIQENGEAKDEFVGPPATATL